MRVSIVTLCTMVVAVATTHTQASLVTDPSAVPSPKKVITFSQFTTGNYLYFHFTSGPIQVGGLVSEDVLWSSDDTGSVIGNGAYGLGTNGSWNAGRSGYVGTNSSTATMRFDFNDGPVSAAGAFVNYAPDGNGDFFLTALGAANVPLESWNIKSVAPISTPGQTNAGAFRGIVRPSNDIHALLLSGAFDVADDLVFSRTAVPDPVSLAIWSGLGAFGVGLRAWRRTYRRAC